MSEDLRTRLTKQMVADCFIEILGTKPLEKITVSEICAKAQVNRATFYRYYANPYDLYENIETWFFNELDSLIKSAMESSERNKAFQGALMALLSFYKDNINMLLAMKNCEGDDNFAQNVLRNTFDTLSNAPELDYPGLTPENDKRMRQYTGRGSAAVVYDWIEEGMVTPIEQLAKFLVNCARGARNSVLDQQTGT